MVATAASSSSPTTISSASSRRSRQTIEEELWLLRSRSFVKSESLRLNSPRSRTSHSKECKRPARRWRRRIRRGDEDNNNNNNFAEKMSNVARKARVFQLRVAGRRTWWPSTMHNTSTAKIAAERDQQQLRHYEADHKLTSIDQFDKSKTQNSEGPRKEHESIPKKKFEWNALWKKKDRSNDQSETSTVVNESSDVDTSLNTTVNDESADEDSVIEIIDIANNIEKEEEKKKKNVAHPFSLGMPVDRLCKRINKSNSEICGVKFPVKTENLEKKDLTKLRVKQLKSILVDRGVECKGCVEKEEFIAMVQNTEHLAGSDEF